MNHYSEICKKNIRPSHMKIMKEIGKAAEKTNEKCLVIGGFVRDCLMNRESDDLDFVCTDIDKITHFLEKKGIAKNITSQKGISTEKYRTNVIMIGNEKVDLVEPRKERYTSSSIKPIVEKGTFYDDAMRRDFTVNTLQLDVSPKKWLHIYDPTEKGIDDLENKILRTPRNPEITFKEDPTRMLRAIRFASCHKFTMLPEIKETIKNMSHEIHRVPSELIHKEIIKGAKCDGYYRTMYNVGLMKEIFPEVTRLKGVKQAPSHHTEDALEHTLRYIEYLPDDSLFKTAGLLHDIGKYNTTDEEGHAYNHEKESVKKLPSILSRLKFSNEEKRRITELVKNHMNLHYLPNNPTEKALRRFVRNNEKLLPELEIMTRADIKADSPTPLKHLKELDKKIMLIENTRKKMQDLIKNNFKIVVNGHDIKRLGYEGKTIGKIKASIENAIIEGRLKNEREEIMKFIKSRSWN